MRSCFASVQLSPDGCRLLGAWIRAAVVFARPRNMSPWFRVAVIQAVMVFDRKTVKSDQAVGATLHCVRKQSSGD
jgi:hypothetical protein